MVNGPLEGRSKAPSAKRGSFALQNMRKWLGPVQNRPQLAVSERHFLPLPAEPEDRRADGGWRQAYSTASRICVQSSAERAGVERRE